MLIRSRWNFTLAAPATLPKTYRLELVKELCRRMEIDRVDVVTNLSFSGILGEVDTHRDFISFSGDRPYHIILSGLDATASKAIADLDLSDGLELFGAKFQQRDRTDETTTYEQLYTTCVANEPEPNYSFDLEFHTPTAFSQRIISLPLPVPASLFRSWLLRWNHFAPIYLGSDELISYLTEYTFIRRHRIRTRSFPLPKGYVNGFIGEVSLQILRRSDPLLANVANLLMSYAPFAGTGVKTRLGMGHTSVVSL